MIVDLRIRNGVVDIPVVLAVNMSLTVPRDTLNGRYVKYLLNELLLAGMTRRANVPELTRDGNLSFINPPQALVCANLQ
jgi:hypothetical protein